MENCLTRKIMRKAGYYEFVGSAQCFIPDPLPPKEPELLINAEASTLYGEAMNQLGQLNGMIGVVPDTKRFINAYITKEAILSSEIEGIHTTLLEVFTSPFLKSKPQKDTQLVLNYKKALDHALELVIKEDLPITNRVILETHEKLMELGVGEKYDPGHFRKQLVQVGNLTPAPPLKIPALMGHLEKFININETVPPLIKAGLAHVQFETIHPFLDGNGRIGRLLIVLMLVKSGMLAAPSLYPSYYFKKHSLEYSQALNRVSTEGDFEGWITFYLSVIKDSCIDAYLRAKDIEALNSKLSKIIIKQDLSDKMEKVRLDALSVLFSYPVINVSDLQKHISTSYNTARQIINEFCNHDILAKDDAKKRGQLFRFQKYIDVLEREYKF